MVRTSYKLPLILILAMVPADLLAGQSTGRTEQSSISNVKEAKAEKDIVKVLEALRQQKGLPKLRRIHDPRLREDACESAKRGRGTGSLYFPGTTNLWIPSGILGDVGIFLRSRTRHRIQTIFRPTFGCGQPKRRTIPGFPTVLVWVSASLAQRNTQRERTGLTLDIT